MREHCIGLINETCELLKQPGVRTNGLSLAIYHDHSAAGIDVEMAMVLGAEWIEANGYQITGPNREIYLQVPQKPGDDGVMEIQYPVEKI